MNIPQEQKAVETSRQEQPAPTTPRRHADWISYAAALTQQAAPAATSFSAHAEF